MLPSCVALLTSVQGFITPLHDGSVYAGHQPGSNHQAEQQPESAGAEAHHNVVEKEKIIEAVEGFSGNQKKKQRKCHLKCLSYL